MKHIKLFEDFINEAISVDATYVHQITGCGQDAAQNFIDDNKIDGKKLADYVKQYRDSKEKYDVRDIIAGTGVGANKSFVKRFIKELK
jgi:putative intracellular protease/amidase